MRLVSTRVLAVSLAALAAASLPAKPTAPDGLDPTREAWRGQGVSLCVADLNAAEGATADDVEAICGCAFDRFMGGRPTEALPPLGPGRFQAVMGTELISCAAGERPAVAAAVARRLAAPPPAFAPPPIGALAPLDAGESEKRPDSAAGPDRRAWLDGLSLPRWLTDSGLPLWVWPPLAVFVLIFLRGLLRHRDGTRDLIGPPPSLRPGARPGPPPPRRPNLPPTG